MHTTVFTDAVADAAGKAQKSQGLSAESFLMSLAVYGTILFCSVVVFSFWKDWKPATFQPKCSIDKEIQFLPSGRIAWVKHLIKLLNDEGFLIQKLGLDSCLALRLLVTAIKMLAPAVILTLPVLLPVYYTAAEAGVTGLDKLSISNIQAEQAERCWIVALVSLLLDLYFCRLLTAEFRKLLRLRQVFLHGRSREPTHLLVTEIPPKMWNADDLRRSLSHFTKGPVEIILPRQNECGYKEDRLSALSEELSTTSHTPSQRKLAFILPAAIQNTRMPIKQWLCMRLQARKLKKDVEAIKSVAIVCFPDLFSAHLALQVRAVSTPLAMEFHIVDDSLLSRLSGIYQSRLMRSLRSLGLTSVLVILAIFWAVPIALTGLLSQLKYLDTLTNRLDGLSNAQLSVIQGIIPQIALSLLMIVFPCILAWLVKLYPLPERSFLENMKIGHYFVFLYTQTFLVVSISSSLTTMIPEIISDFRSIPAILAKNLPKASNYFYPYMVLQAVCHCVMVLFQLPEKLITFLVCRQRKDSLRTTEWSLEYAVFTNLLSICIAFSVISPLLLAVGLSMFAVFLVVYSYQAIYVLEGSLQSQGLLYWDALHQIFIGIYTKDLFLLGLFALRNAFGPMIIAVVLLIGVALTQKYIQRNFWPLAKYVSAIE